MDLTRHKEYETAAKNKLGSLTTLSDFHDIYVQPIQAGPLRRMTDVSIFKDALGYLEFKFYASAANKLFSFAVHKTDRRTKINKPEEIEKFELIKLAFKAQLLNLLSSEETDKIERVSQEINKIDALRLIENKKDIERENHTCSEEYKAKFAELDQKLDELITALKPDYSTCSLPSGSLLDEFTKNIHVSLDGLCLAAPERHTQQANLRSQSDNEGKPSELLLKIIQQSFKDSLAGLHLTTSEAPTQQTSLTPPADDDRKPSGDILDEEAHT